MSSIAKTSISLSKKDLVKSRIPPVASRNVTFYHKATGGQITINLNSLIMPSEMPSQVQATNDEISGARLALNKKNLTLTSSSNGVLIQGLDYLVTSSYTIQLTGVYTGIGAETDEIFVGSISSAPISDLAVISARDVVKTMTVVIGQTTVNLGNEYKVGANPLEDIGDVRIWINGVLAIRDANYTEVDSGNGFGSTIELIGGPVIADWQLVAEFGVRAVTDQDALGTIESLSGSILKIANDLADVAGTNTTDYLTANPSDIERRTFGDTVLNLDSKFDTTQNLSEYTKTKYQRKYLPGNLTANTSPITSLGLNNLVIGKTYRLKVSWKVVSGTGGDGAFNVVHNGVTILPGSLNVDATATTVAITSADDIIFVASATTITATLSVTGSFTVIGNGTESGTWIQLEELPNHAVTTDWT